jgi:hypothetical protein
VKKDKDLYLEIRKERAKQRRIAPEWPGQWPGLRGWSGPMRTMLSGFGTSRPP